MTLLFRLLHTNLIIKTYLSITCKLLNFVNEIVIIKAGKVCNEVPYPLLIPPNANMSYTIFLFPQETYQMGKTPYMKASVGIENIFNAVRMDYVWRLNYLNHPNIQKSCIRATIALIF